jgi:type III secretion system FlhB-like substrate exporter
MSVEAVKRIEERILQEARQRGVHIDKASLESKLLDLELGGSTSVGYWDGKK